MTERQSELIANYSIIEDPQERLAAIVDDARRQPALEETARTDSTRVHGCISQAWVTAEERSGRFFFRSDADSPLVRGLVKVLCDLYSDAVPADIIATEPIVFEELGIARNLSPTRLNGLRSVRAKIRAAAAGAGP